MLVCSFEGEETKEKRDCFQKASKRNASKRDGKASPFTYPYFWEGPKTAGR
jgi:hypothetical protein